MSDDTLFEMDYSKKLYHGAFPAAQATSQEQLKTLKEVLDKRALDKQIGGDHYKKMKIQPTEYNMANELGWCEGNAIKYITRYKQKGQAQDIEKAIHYLQILLESLKNGS